MAALIARAFNISVLTDPNTQRSASFTYMQGLLMGVTSGTTTCGTLSYYPNLLVSQVSHGNGITEMQTNDPNEMRRPASLSASGTYASWSSGTYGYDGTGNVKTIGSATFTYDSVSRLVASSLYDGPTGGGNLKQQSYTFDAFGNLTNIGGTSGRTTPTSPQTNRLNGTGTAYDAAGNLTNWNSAVYNYDDFNQMTHMTSGTQEWVYLYTADDERIWMYNIPANSSRWTLRDLGGKVLREYLSSSRWSVGTDYFYRDGLLLAAETQTGQRHFHLDHLGTPRLITRGSGYSAAYHVYYPFGEEATAFNQDTERMKFTGHERDLASPSGAGDDLDYMHARHESPVTGRFLSPDPLRWVNWQNGSREERQQFREFIANPQNFNLYEYVANNPMNRTDLHGLKGCQAGDKKFGDCTITIVYDPKTSKGTLTVTGQNKGDKGATVLLTSSVVVGGDGHVTPTGTFTASVWEKDHVSTQYGSAANTPWSKTLFGGNAFGPYQLHIKELEGRGIYIHGTMGPKWSPTTWGNSIFLSPASHGCVRMCNSDIFTLHDIMPNPKGNKIVISNEPEPED